MLNKLGNQCGNGQCAFCLAHTQLPEGFTVEKPQEDIQQIPANQRKRSNPKADETITLPPIIARSVRCGGCFLEFFEIKRQDIIFLK